MDQIFVVTSLLFLVLLIGFGLGEFRYRRARARWLMDSAALQERATKVDARSQAAYRSKYVASAAEKVAPYLPGFPLLPREVKFLGDPIDFVGFSGLGDESLVPAPITIYLIEVKTGQSTLGRDQLRIMDAVQKKRIVWVEYRPSLEDTK